MPHALAIVLVLSVVGCRDYGDRPRSTFATESPPAAAETSMDSLRNRLSRLAAAAGGRVGVSAVLLDSDVSVALLPDERFRLQSVWKLPLAMTVLAAVDEGRLQLDRPVRIETEDILPGRAHNWLYADHPDGVTFPVSRLLRAAVSGSDGTAADALAALVGGPEAVTTQLRELGIDSLVIALTERGTFASPDAPARNWTTPVAATALLQALHEGRGLSGASRERLLELMTVTTLGANRLKARLPEGTSVSHKTGTSATLDGVTAATNDIGIVTLPDGRRVAIAVFVADSPADEATREGVIAAAARAVVDYWGSRAE